MKGFYLRNGRWLARLTIPKDVRDIIGKHVFLESLGIEAKAQAEIHALQIMSKWKLGSSNSRFDSRQVIAANFRRMHIVQ